MIARLLERLCRCPATTSMLGATHRCEMWRGHLLSPGHQLLHFSDRLRPLSAMQWPDGWQGDRPPVPSRPDPNQSIR